MKKLMLLFAFAGLLFACKTEQKTNSNDNTVEELQKAVEESNTDLASYEYVCNHCKIGSHEAGTCPCGMEYEKNVNFKASADLSSYEYVCEHCQKGSHEAGKCACGMEMVKNPEFSAADNHHDHEDHGHDHHDKKKAESM